MRVLQIATYPIQRPLHGGQIRVSNIHAHLKRLDCDVRSISFSEPSHKYFDDDRDLILKYNELNKEIQTPFSTDLATALVSKNSKQYYRFLKKHMDEFSPDYIFLEHPWVWPLVKRYLKNKPREVKIIYSSHNVEYLTKHSLFKSNNITDANNVVEKIKSIEFDLIKHCNFVIACTPNDLNHYVESANLDKKKGILCPNGVSPISHEIRENRSFIDILAGRKYALCVGSAYPPNAQGFWKMMGSSLAWLKEDEFIFVAGGCSSILEDFCPKEGELLNMINFGKIKRLGIVNNSELHTLINCANAIILPITDGGGSNLKTAEAIISMKPVVATKTSCRGFDDVEEYSQFHIADSSKAFKAGIKKYLRENTKLTFSDKEKELRKKVLWSNTLVDLKKIFN